MKDEEIEKLSVERQKYQMHKKGYSDIVKAIESIPKNDIVIPEFPEIEQIDMTETNNLLKDIAQAIKEDITIELVIK